MSEEQVRHLMAVIRQRLRHAQIDPQTQPEYDDMLAEAYVAGWRAVERRLPDSRYSWQMIAAQAGLNAARSYLWRKRSGRVGSRQTLTPAYRARWHGGRLPTDAEWNVQKPPLPLSSLTPARLLTLEPVWDGGFPAADARLQLWLLRPRLTDAQEEILRLLYRDGLTMSEAARRLGIAIPSAQHRYQSALRKYRRAAGL